MLKPSAFTWMALLGYGYCISAFSCEAIDSSFEPIGRIASSSVDDYLANGRVAHLGTMLGARYARKVGDPKIRSLHLSVNSQTQKLQITHELETGIQGPKFRYGVVCIGDEWGYSDSGQTGAEGIYRKYELRVRLRVLPDGDIEVRNEDTIVRGAISKTRSSGSVVARFSKLSTVSKSD